MQRLISCLVLLACLPMAANAANFTDKYSPVTLKALTELASHFPVVTLSDEAAYTEFLKITDCETYRQVKTDQFKLQNMKQSLVKQRQSEAAYKDVLRFYIPVTFLTNGYNFDTQSLNLTPEGQLVRVDKFQLFNDLSPVCGERLFLIANLPTNYYVKLNFPVSMRRIPLQKTVAESLTNRLDKNEADPQTRIIYGNIYLEIEPVGPELIKPPEKRVVFVRGQVDAINLYVDAERKILFKQINYGAAF